ncbi:MAG: response regulator [Pseudomonadota bacterium]|nr:response regulator [Pseudomonadota bacterium]
MNWPARVLVVDDDPNNRDILDQELEFLGCRAVPAANGREALERLKTETFDLVLLDIMMPELDGFEVLRRLRADPAHRELPVVMVSALDDLDSVVRCISLGADDYLPKPFDPVLLKARVNASLEKKSWRDQEAAYLRRIEQQLQEIERERRRADQLLEAILPASAVAELKTAGRVTSRRHNDVAVLFADIIEFTRYSETRSPEEVVESLDRLIAACERHITAHGMEKIKTVGDGVVGTANLLRPHDDPVMACVRCGLAIVETARQDPAQWRMRVGIGFGSAVAGVVGRSKFSFDLWGDAVNVASRLSGFGDESAVYLTEDAWAHVRGRCRGESLGPIPIRGKGRIEVYRCDAIEAPLDAGDAAGIRA